MSTILRPSLKAQAFTDRWQVEIVDLTATYRRNAGMKSAAILDGAEFCRVEEFAARHFRRSGFEATFVESAPFHVLFGVFFWSVIQDRCDRQVRTVGIMARPGDGQGGPQRVDMDTTAVRLWEFRLLTPSGQGPHQASLSHRRNEGRAASPV
jgi:hypothetical protein